MSQVPPGNPTAAIAGRIHGLRPQVLLGICLAVFSLVLLFVIPSPSKFHGDERYYTDASIQMVQTGDYWTPYYADGRIRLLKPILTYWALAGSFQILGISMFAARLPFLLAGTLVVYLTYQLARTVMQNQQTALLAALIMASNVELMTICTRATPDVLVCLFILMSMWGFARLWFQQDQTFVGPLLAYGGMGLAIQTKGLLGLCPLAVNVLFWLVARRSVPRNKNFLNWPAILLGLSVGAFWYVIMLQRHGWESIQDFYDDQVGTKISVNPGFVAVNFATYLFAAVRYFLPWTLFLLALIIAWRRGLVEFWRQHRNECLFLTSLFVVLVVVFAFGNMRRPRYLVAAYPMLSVLMAGVLSNIGPLKAAPRWLHQTIKVVAAFVAIVGVGLLLAGIGTDWRLLAGGLILILLGITGLLAARSTIETPRWIWMAGVSVITFGVFGACLRPAFSPSPLAQAAEMLTRTTTAGTTVFLWRATDSAAGQLRLLSRGKLTIKPLNAERPDLSAAETVIATAPNQETLEGAGYSLREVNCTNTVLAASWLGRWVANYSAKPDKQAEPTYWIAVRSPSRQP
jgi:4-amino-4-deoxy-L-arabinose transferase-like glycosyltransferase